MNRQVILKNNAPFISCISKINFVLFENAEDLDIVIPMYNVLKYSKYYSKTSTSLWNYYRDELIDETNDNNGPNKNVINSKSFKYKTSITGSTYNVSRRITDTDGNLVNNPNYDQNKRGTKEVEIAMPLKHLSNFWKMLDIPLINCGVSLALSWSANCVITSSEKKLVRAAQGGNPAVYDDSPTNAVFKIKHCKLYVPVVTLSAERTIKWNKYRSEMSNQPKNSLNYLIDPKFTNVNRLFVLTFENEDNRTSFSKYYLPKVEIKDFNVLIDGKPVFEIPVKNKEEAYEAIIEITKNNDYTTGNLLNYYYFKYHYQLIAIDLSKQTELENTDLKQINFVGRLHIIMQQCSLLLRKKQKLVFMFHKIM